MIISQGFGRPRAGTTLNVPFDLNISTGEQITVEADQEETIDLNIGNNTVDVEVEDAEDININIGSINIEIGVCNE